MVDFTSRSEMRRLAMQAPDKLIKKIEELNEQVRLLSAPMFEDLGGGYQKCSHPGMKKIFEIARKLQAERDEARRQLARCGETSLELCEKLTIARTTLDAVAVESRETRCLNVRNHELVEKAIAKIDEVKPLAKIGGTDA